MEGGSVGDLLTGVGREEPAWVKKSTNSQRDIGKSPLPFEQS